MKNTWPLITSHHIISCYLNTKCLWTNVLNQQGAQRYITTNFLLQCPKNTAHILYCIWQKVVISDKWKIFPVFPDRLPNPESRKCHQINMAIVFISNCIHGFSPIKCITLTLSYRFIFWRAKHSRWRNATMELLWVVSWDATCKKYYLYKRGSNKELRFNTLTLCSTNRYKDVSLFNEEFYLPFKYMGGLQWWQLKG